MHKRKAIESAQSAADLKLHLEKYHGQIKEVTTLSSQLFRFMILSPFSVGRCPFKPSYVIFPVSSSLTSSVLCPLSSTSASLQVQQTVAEKTSALEAEAFKTKRMQVRGS